MVLALGALPLGPHEGHVYHMNNFESPATKDDSCQVWLKSGPCVFKKKMKQLLFTKAPLPNLLPSTGAHWGHPGNCHEQLLFFT